MVEKFDRMYKLPFEMLQTFLQWCEDVGLGYTVQSTQAIGEVNVMLFRSKGYPFPRWAEEYLVYPMEEMELDPRDDEMLSPWR